MRPAAGVLWGAVRRIAITGAALLVLCVVGFIWFAAPPSPENQPAPTDAIVVLTGGRLRLQSGMDLLRDGKGRKLFVSGVNQQVDLNELLRISGNAPDWAICCTALGHDADDTIGNARETAQWMRRQGFSSLRLVTAWYHMPRSLLELNRAMPEVEIIAHPVFPDEVSQEHWWAARGTALLLASEYGKYLGALLRPVVERLRSAPSERSAEAEIGR
ncbi:MAG TPA: YdcF family protein [Stellaceae bacterium]|nr:YdcF family protein [Stellaceae bacterium]